MPRRIARCLVPIVVTVVLAGACADEITLPPDADAELQLGLDVYEGRCARCHGPSGGGGIGPGLGRIEDRLDDAAQLDVVVNGRESMPRFASVLSPEEIEAVVRFTREIL